MYQQGDILIEVVESFPGDAKKLDHLVLMDGELTGHKHQVIEGKAVLYEKDGTLYLSAKSKCVIGHDEHHAQTIAPGKYKIRQVVEQDPFEDAVRSVRD